MTSVLLVLALVLVAGAWATTPIRPEWGAAYGRVTKAVCVAGGAAPAINRSAVSKILLLSIEPMKLGLRTDSHIQLHARLEMHSSACPPRTHLFPRSYAVAPVQGASYS